MKKTSENDNGMPDINDSRLLVLKACERLGEAGCERRQVHVKRALVGIAVACVKMASAVSVRVQLCCFQSLTDAAFDRSGFDEVVP